MRKSREEIIEMFPSYEREENLIEKIYGDIPCLVIYLVLDTI